MYMNVNISKFFSEEAQDFLNRVQPCFEIRDYEIATDTMTIYIGAHPHEIDEFAAIAGAN